MLQSYAETAKASQWRYTGDYGALTNIWLSRGRVMSNDCLLMPYPLTYPLPLTLTPQPQKTTTRCKFSVFFACIVSIYA